MSDNLKSKTVKGLKWSSLSQITRQVLQYISTLVLVGVLPPEDFGLMSMALIITGFLEIFKDLGTGSALIQKESLSKKIIASIFWLNLGFGALIALVLYLISPLFALIYNVKEITSILQILSISFLIAGTSIIHKALLEKQLYFKELSIIELLSSFISFVIGIYLAISGYGVWSLVFQSLTYTSLNSLMLWIFSNWKPSFHFDIKDVKLLSSFSLNLTGFNIVNYFARNMDYFIIGKFLGDRPLGHYYLAYRIMLYPIQNITWVVSRVLFPSFSRIQNDNKRFKSAYIKITNSVALLTFPIMAGMAFLSHEFVATFFGRNWDVELVSMLIMILAPVGALQSVISTVGNIYQAKGRTDWMFKWSIFYSTFTIIGFFIGIRWGTIGVAYSYLITNLILIYPVFSIPFKLIELQPIKFFKSFASTFFAIAIMLGILYLSSSFIQNLNDLSRLVILSFVGGSVYIIISFILNRKYLLELKLFF